MSEREKWKKRGSETYEDNESSKECIDDMWGRNFELPENKNSEHSSDVCFVERTHWVEIHVRVDLLWI
jgi:hypothetical protein